MEVRATLTDDKLLQLLKTGDELAFAELFKRYSSLLFNHAYKKLQDKEAAKDVVQEVFSNLWHKRQQLFLKSNLGGYLYTAVRNKIFDLIAHQQVESSYISSFQTFLDQDSALADHSIREKQLKEIIDSEIASLPPRMRAIFEMSRKEHKSHKEIAFDLGITESTVTDQVKKALKILKLRLGAIIYLLLVCNFFISWFL